MNDSAVLEALEETRDQLNPAIPTDLLRQLLRVEVAHAFDEERQQVAFREIEAIIDRFLAAGNQS